MVDIDARQAVQSDLPQLTRLLEELFAIEEDFHYSHDLQMQGLGLLLESESGTILVAAESTGTVVGMITGQIVLSTAEGGRSLLVEDLIVDERFRARGIGKLLLEKIEEWGHEFGARRMQLLADRKNHRALEFYAHSGWQQTKLICLRKYCEIGAK